MTPSGYNSKSADTVMATDSVMAVTITRPDHDGISRPAPSRISAADAKRKLYAYLYGNAPLDEVVRAQLVAAGYRVP